MLRPWLDGLLAISITLYSLTSFVCVAAAGERLDAKQARADEKRAILWYDIRPLGLEGQGWKETKAPFDRLPAKAEGVVRPPVWGLSRNSAGLAVRFRSDSPSIHCRWTLTGGNLALPHMPATGVSGVDLYVKTDDGTWRWLAVGRPTQTPTNEAALVSNLPAGERDYCLYLPLYNGVSQVEIGIAKDKSIAKLPRDEKHSRPIVYWGTSITQGGCASRPGMVHTAILSRRLDRPAINLGFSGNGKMEPEVAALMAEIDAEVFVIDCLPNMTAAEVAERIEPLVAIVRKSRPTTPILLVEDRTYTDAHLLADKRRRNDESRVQLRKAYDKLSAAGDGNLYYLAGEDLLGDDDEATVDGSHPTDLGFMRMADAFEKVLRPLLTK